MARVYPFEALDLSFALSDLEPSLNSDITRTHYIEHYMRYVDELNHLLSAYPQYKIWSLPKLVAFSSALPQGIRAKVKNAAGGVFNHELYWYNMQCFSCEIPSPNGCLLKEINISFGDFAAFRKQFADAAEKLTGSGWVWLVVENRSGKLNIETTSNQDTPLSSRFSPILNLDMWEHAYYLQYQNDKSAYIDAWWHLLNWDNIAELYALATQPNTTDALFTLAGSTQQSVSVYPHNCKSNIEAIPAGESYYAHKHPNSFTNACGGKAYSSNSYYSHSRSRRKRRK